MIFKRKLYNKLLVWKQQATVTKALLIDFDKVILSSPLS